MHQKISDLQQKIATQQTQANSKTGPTNTENPVESPPTKNFMMDPQKFDQKLVAGASYIGINSY